MSLLKELTENLKEHVKNAGYEVETLALEPSNRRDLGEYQLNDAMQLAKKYRCVVLASGERDIISDGEKVCAVANGRKEMSLITGTGCILNVLCAVYMSVCDPLTACTAAAVLFGISGELADVSKGMASYRINMLDKFYTLSDDEIKQKAALITDI